MLLLLAAKQAAELLPAAMVALKSNGLDILSVHQT
jgi:hypothetical protein